MNERYILVMDSGLGGISTLSAVSALLPNNYIYFADYLAHPYGNKSIDLVRQRLAQIVSRIQKKYPLVGVIIACNTATAMGISYLRAKFPSLRIIGMEPALNCALKTGKNVLLLATPNTLNYSKLVRSKEKRVICVPLDRLASLVERNIFSLCRLKPYLEKKLSRFVGEVDSVVLGCTHYIFLLPILRRIFGRNVSFFDGNLGVANRCRAVFEPLSKNSIVLSTNDTHRKKNLVKAWALCQEGICVE